jgi:anti-sigma regulatory factor (Ser/Thr protein kinase)
MHEPTARHATTTPPVVGARTFPAHPCQVGEARRFLAGVLDGCPVADDAVLCLSELASNAVLHSNSRQPGGSFTVRLEMHPGDGLRVEVADRGGPWTQPGRVNGEHGRGLLIVSRLARDWGISGNSRTGRTVWFVLPAPVPRPFDE